MNSFGRLFKVSIFGESHGDAVGVVIDGCPAGTAISIDEMKRDLERRKSGLPGTTARKETDEPRVASGMFNGRATGAPIMIMFENKDVRSGDYESLRNTPRPGHADFVAWKKYGGFNDYRGGGHFSGRLTVGLTAAGSIARQILHPTLVEAKLLEAGGSVDIEKTVAAAVEEKDSIGGLIECRVSDLFPGIGEPFFDSLESLISHAVFSIPGVKGIEFGAGFACAGMKGSEFNDRILDWEGTTETNHAGGINGGISNGNDIVFRIAVRPAASINQVQKTIDLQTGEVREIIVGGRHDACIALRFPVIVESVTAIVLVDLMMQMNTNRKVIFS